MVRSRDRADDNFVCATTFAQIWRLIEFALERERERGDKALLFSALISIIIYSSKVLFRARNTNTMSHFKKSHSIAKYEFLSIESFPK